MSHVVLLHPTDDVAIAINAVPANTTLTVGAHQITTRREIPAGHKVAVRAIENGGHVRRYGSNIGRATQPIAAGDHVHSHNLHHQHSPPEFAESVNPPPSPTPIIGRTFMGFPRSDGRVGTRNYIAIVSTVNCSASVAHVVCERLGAEVRERYPHVDGIMPVAHEGGCGMAYGGLKHQMLARTLVGLARNPNVAGCVLVGLGCEQGTMGYLANDHGLVPLKAPDGTILGGNKSGPPIPMLSIQDEGGYGKTIERTMAAAREFSAKPNDCAASPAMRNT